MQTKSRYTLHGVSGSILLTLLFFLIIPATKGQWSKSNCPRSQKQAEVWYFGERAGVDFRSGNAVPLNDQNKMNAFQATSSICDSLGNFLFYTNGWKVWDAMDSLMPNATNLSGNPGTSQPCVIVPWPGDPTLYYIFTIDAITYDLVDSTKYSSRGLCYTVIDMKLRNGLGNAISAELNHPLLTPVCQKITAVSNRDRTGFWVIAHKWESDEFYAYLVTSSGISAPIVSAVGAKHSATTKAARNNAVGYMKCSPDGNRLALAVTYDKLVELFDFNNETGAITNPKSYHISKTGINPYGIEFSPDSKKLYNTALEYLGGIIPQKPTCIYQFDIANGFNTPVIVDSVTGIRLYAMQLGTDGRIYLSRTHDMKNKMDSLEVIYNPNRPDTACNFSRLNNVPGVGFPLLGRKSIYSVPNFVQSFLYFPPFTWDSVCHGDATQFQIINKANIDSVTWNFGDGGTSTAQDPIHSYTNPGTYWVKLTEKFNGQAFTDSVLVTNYPLPVVALGGDTVLLYKGSSINLHAGGGYTEYLWSTGSQDSIITVGSQGSYWAQVKDVHCCYNRDTTYVQVFEYFIPNAFSPNGDGLNDIFRVMGLYKKIDFKMYVYNRWGQIMFESDDIEKGWDGTSGGTYCPADTYVWIVNVAFLGQDIITEGDIVFKGTVTLVR